MDETESKRDRVRTRLLQSLPKGGRVAEVGVWEGAFSRKILDICEPAELHLIDPWLYQPEFPNTGFGRRKNEELMEQKYQAVCAAFADDPRVTIHRAMSDVALSGFADGYLDWVYLDGNHNEPFIGADIALSLQKVKPDGLITGDDFNWMSEAQGAPVKRAVEQAVADLGSMASLKTMANQWIVTLGRAA